MTSAARTFDGDTPDAETPDSGTPDAGTPDVPAADALATVLDSIGADYEIVACDPDLADTAEFCAAYGWSVSDSANTIVVVGKSDPRVYAACVVLADCRLDVNGVVRKRLGARKASFASGDETVELTGMMIGGVTPVGLPADLPLWIDAAVMQRERVVLGGGSRDRKVLGHPALLARLPNAEVIDGLARPITP